MFGGVFGHGPPNVTNMLFSVIRGITENLLRHTEKTKFETPDEDKNADEDEDPNDECAPILKADATGLAEYLEGLVLPDCATQLGYVENHSVIRAQVLGEALDLGRLEPLGRYEIQLDRKLERMLAMLLRLHSLRRSNESS